MVYFRTLQYDILTDYFGTELQARTQHLKPQTVSPYAMHIPVMQNA